MGKELKKWWLKVHRCHQWISSHIKLWLKQPVYIQQAASFLKKIKCLMSIRPRKHVVIILLSETCWTINLKDFLHFWNWTLGPLEQGTLTEWGSSDTVEHLIKVTCFFFKVNNFKISKATDLNLLVQGGQLYSAFPFSKDYLIKSYVLVEFSPANLATVTCS